MARAIDAFLHDEDYVAEYSPAYNIFIQYGFVKTDYYGEDAWVLEIEENNSAFYAKFETYGRNIFILSTWVIKHDDVDKNREYFPHDYGSLLEIKLYWEITNVFAKCFDKKLVSKTIYTIE
ncbi:MAG: hypothetical protein IJD88_05335 [Clostridia bacterium]|nr:hypothetical protein [Clostridia bacterium]